MIKSFKKIAFLFGIMVVVLASAFSITFTMHPDAQNIAVADGEQIVTNSNYWEDCAVSPFDDVQNTGSAGSDDTIYIRSAENLAWLAVTANTADKSSKYYSDGKMFCGYTIELLADIDLSSKLWVPIGYPDGQHWGFYGNFNGNGHIVRGVTFDSTQSYDGMFKALFGRLVGWTARIKDLIVEDCEGTSACLVGQYYYWSGSSSVQKPTIAQCVSRGGKLIGKYYEANSATSGDFNIGGSDDYKVYNCVSNGTKWGKSLSGGAGVLEYENKYIGTDNAYYEYDDSHKGWLSAGGTIAIATASSGKYISKITVGFYEFNFSSGCFQWRSVQVLGSGGNGESYDSSKYCNAVSLNYTSGCTGGKTASLVTDKHSRTIKINYAHQVAVKIEIEETNIPKTVNFNFYYYTGESPKDVYDNGSYTTETTGFSKAEKTGDYDPISAITSCLQYKFDKTASGTGFTSSSITNIPVSAEKIYFSVKESCVKYISGFAITSGGFTEWTLTDNEHNECELSVSGDDSITLNCFIRNINAISINNGVSKGVTGETNIEKITDHIDSTTSATGYLVRTINKTSFSNYSANFYHDITSDFEGVAATYWTSDSNYEDSYVRTTSSGDLESASSHNYSYSDKWDGRNLADGEGTAFSEIYAVYVLKQVTLNFGSVDNTSYTVYAHNPYSNDSYEATLKTVDSVASLTAYKTFSYYIISDSLGDCEVLILQNEDEVEGKPLNNNDNVTIYSKGRFYYGSDYNDLERESYDEPLYNGDYAHAIGLFIDKNYGAGDSYYYDVYSDVVQAKLNLKWLVCGDKEYSEMTADEYSKSIASYSISTSGSQIDGFYKIASRNKFDEVSIKEFTLSVTFKNYYYSLFDLASGDGISLSTGNALDMDGLTQKYTFKITNVSYDRNPDGYTIKVCLKEYFNQMKTTIIYTSDTSVVAIDSDLVITRSSVVPSGYNVPVANSDAVKMPTSDHVSAYSYRYFVNYHTILSYGLYYNGAPCDDDDENYTLGINKEGGVSLNIAEGGNLPYKTRAYELRIVVKKELYYLDVYYNDENVGNISYTYDNTVSFIITSTKGNGITGVNIIPPDPTKIIEITASHNDKISEVKLRSTISEDNNENLFNGGDSNVSYSGSILLEYDRVILTKSFNTPIIYNDGCYILRNPNKYYTYDTSEVIGTTDIIQNFSSTLDETNSPDRGVYITNVRDTLSIKLSPLTPPASLKHVEFKGYRFRYTEEYKQGVNVDKIDYGPLYSVGTISNISSFIEAYLDSDYQISYIPVYGPIEYTVTINGADKSLEAKVFYNNINKYSNYLFSVLNTFNISCYDYEFIINSNKLSSLNWNSNNTLATYNTIKNQTYANNNEYGLSTGKTLNNLIDFMINNSCYTFDIGYKGIDISFCFENDSSIFATYDNQLYGYGCCIGSTYAKDNIINWTSINEINANWSSLVNNNGYITSGSIKTSNNTIEDLLIGAYSKGYLVKSLKIGETEILHISPTADLSDGIDIYSPKRDDDYIFDNVKFLPSDFTPTMIKHNGRESYTDYITIDVDMVSNTQTVTFDGTFIPGSNVTARVVPYTNKYLAGTTGVTNLSFVGKIPSRNGYTFNYFKAVDTAGNEYYVYLDSNGDIDSTETSIVNTYEQLTFYAYWTADVVSFTSYNKTKTYDAKAFGDDYGVSIGYISMNDIDRSYFQSTQDGSDYSFSYQGAECFFKSGVLEIYKKGANPSDPDIKIWNSADSNHAEGLFDLSVIAYGTGLGIYLLNLKYTSDGGSFYVKYNYIFNGTGAYSSDYILNSDDMSSVTSELSTITITPKQLSVKGTITKEYDRDNSVPNNITGICDEDKEYISVSAIYTDVNAGENKDITYSFVNKKANPTDEQQALFDKISGSYELPTQKGEITPIEINVVFDSVRIYYSEGGLTNTTILDSVDIVGGEIHYSERSRKYFDGEISVSDISAQKVDGVDRIIEFSLYAGTNATNGVNNVSNAGVILSELFVQGYDGEEVNYKFVYTGEIEFVKIGTNERLITVGVEQEYVSGGSSYAFSTNANIELQTIVPTVSNGNYFQFIGSKGQLEFTVNIELLNNYWYQSVVCNNVVLNDVIYTKGVDGDTLTITLPENKNDIYIRITNYSNVTYNFGLFADETLNSVSPSVSVVNGTYTKKIKYNSTITSPTPSRNGLEFDGWYYYDYSTGNLNKYIDAKWLFTGDVTLYAKYTLNATITKAGNISEISGDYDPSITYEFGFGVETDISNHKYGFTLTGAGASFNANYLTIKCQKYDPSIKDYTNLSGNKISVKNVADNGRYRIVVGVDSYYTIGSIDFKIIEPKITPASDVTVYISPKEIDLGEIELPYDINKTYSITLLDSMLSRENRYKTELVDKTAQWTLQGSGVGLYENQILQFTDSNYEIKANIKIVRRNVTIAFTDDAYNYVKSNNEAVTATQDGTTLHVTYTGNMFMVEDQNAFKVDDNDGLDGFSDKYNFANIFAKTNSSEVGTYNISNNSFTINGSSDLIPNFNVTWACTIVIDNASLSDEYVEIFTNSKVYNGESQTFENGDILVFDEPSYEKVHSELTVYFTYSVYYYNQNDSVNNYKGASYEGRTNVGQDSVVIEINYPNYSTKYVYTTFEITKLNASIKSVSAGSDDYTKVYDGTTSVIKYDATNTDGIKHSVVFTNLYGGESLKDIISRNIEFNFKTKNVGNQITILGTQKANSNITQEDLNVLNNINISFDTFKGNITKKSATLKIVGGSYSTAYNGQNAIIPIENLQLVDDYDNDALAGDDVISSGFLTTNVKLASAIAYDISSPGIVTIGCTVGITLNDNLDIATNYNITCSGELYITKAQIALTISSTDAGYTSEELNDTIKSYISAKIGELEVSYENAPLLSMLNISIKQGGSAANAIYVGNYDVKVDLKSEYQSNYKFVLNGIVQGSSINDNSLSYTFKIKQANLTIKVEDSKQFNGNKFTVNFEEKIKLNGFENDFVYSGSATTANSIAKTYKYPLQDGFGIATISGVVIYKKGTTTDVTYNYDISYDISLEITKNTPDGFIKLAVEEYTYNGSTQDIIIEIGGTIYKVSTATNGAITFKDEDNNPIPSEYDGEELELTLSAKSSETSDDEYSNVPFKYVRSRYILRVHSSSFDDTYELHPKINPRLIENITIEPSTKVYDGTTNLAIDAEITSTEIADSDKDHVVLLGQYSSKDVGINPINITMKEITSCSEGRMDYYLDLLAASYILQNGTQVDGEITARQITFTYNQGITKHYYSANALTLDLSQFSVSGNLYGETFTGSVTFNNVVNAGDYELEDEIVDTQSISPEKLMVNYNFVFAGTVHISRAQIKVESLTSSQTEYDGNAHTTGYTLAAFASRGSVPENAKLLDIKYNGKSEAGPDAGTYNLSFTVKDEYASNYKLASYADCAGNYNKTFTITPKVVTIEVARNELFDSTYAISGYTYILQNNNVVTLVSGHNVDGAVAIESSECAPGTFVYQNVLKTNGVSVSVVIKDSDNNDVTDNYSLNYNVTLMFGDDGIGAVSSIDTVLTYNAENQKSTIPVSLKYRVVAYGELYNITDLTLNQTYTDTTNEITFTFAGYAIYDGVAYQPLPQATEIKNVGMYFAIINVAFTGSNVCADWFYGQASGVVYAKINIIEHEISLSNLYYGSEVFNRTKIFDGDAELALTINGDSVVALDNQNGALISVKATFCVGTTPNANAGSKTIVYEILNNTLGNYKLSSNQSDGSILKKSLIITGLDADYTNPTYQGEVTHQIEATSLVVTGLPQDYYLKSDGYIEVKVKNAGTYLLKEILVDSSNLKVLFDIDVSQIEDATENFIIEVDDLAQYIVNKATVTLSYNQNLMYNGTNQHDMVKAGLTVSGTYTTGAGKDDIELTLKFNYTPNVDGIEYSDNTSVIDAGEYCLSSTQAPEPTTNFIYVIHSTNNSFKVTQKALNINLGENSVAYKTYIANNDYFKLNETMTEDIYSKDVGEFRKVVFKIDSSQTIIAGQTYTYASGEVIIDITANVLINNNYYLNSAEGSIKIKQENIKVLDYSNIVYDGTDHLNGIVLEYNVNNSANNNYITINYTGGVYSVSLDAGNTDYVSVVSVNGTNANNQANNNEIKDAGNYDIVLSINTVEYTYTIIVLPKEITSANILYTKNKSYDGTNVVKNNEQNIAFKNGIIESCDKDYVSISATYSSYKVNETGTPLQITFEISGDRAFNYYLNASDTGNITAVNLEVSFGSQGRQYSKDGKYTLTYTLAETLVSGDSVYNGDVTFDLGILNKVGEAIALSNVNITKEGLVLHRGDDDVTDCYHITYNGYLTITKRTIEITITTPQPSTAIFNNADRKNLLGFTIDNESNLEEIDFSSKISLTYKYNDSSTTEVKNVGEYTISAILDAEYVGRYSLSFTEKTFEILPYTYTLTDDDYDLIAFSKEYSKADPELVQTFIIPYAEGTMEGEDGYSFDILFTREVGEAVGVYDLTGATSQDGNISIVVDTSKLVDKFTITQNTSSIKIVITGIKSGASIDYMTITGNTIYRAYGYTFNHFDLSLFDFDVYVGDEKIEDLTLLAYLADTTAGGTMSGYVSFDIGMEHAGATQYNIRELNAELTTVSSLLYRYVLVETDESVKLVINKRIITVTPQQTSKKYDGTTSYNGEYLVDYNTSSYGECDYEAGVNIEFNSANVLEANILNITLTEAYIDNFELTFNSVSASIQKLNVTVSIDDNTLTIDYGADIIIGYEVSATESTILSAQALKDEVVVTATNADTNLSSSGHTKVGEYVIVLSSDNLNITNAIDKTLTIQRIAVNVIPDRRITKIQDLNTNINILDYTFVIENVLADDDVILVSAKYTDDSILIGDNLSITYTLGGVDGENYFANNGEGDITQKQISFVLHYKNYVGCSLPIDERVLVSGTEVGATEETAKFDYYKSLNDNTVKLPEPMHYNFGYTFNGWSYNGIILTKNDELYTQIEPYAEEVDLYAEWEINTYNVSITVLYEELKADDLLKSKYFEAFSENYVLNYNTTVYYDTDNFTFTIGETEVQLNSAQKLLLANHSLARFGYKNSSNIAPLAESYTINVGLTYSGNSIDIRYYYELDSVAVTLNANAGNFNQDSLYLFVPDNSFNVDSGFIAKETDYSYSLLNNYKVTYKDGFTKLEFTLKCGQKLNIFDVLSNSNDLLDYLNTENIVYRLGYTFDGWGTSVANIINATAQTDENNLYEAVWQANEYILTLDAGDGSFSLSDEQISAGWEYVENSSNKQIKIVVCYDAEIPELPQAYKIGYTFRRYNSESGGESPIKNQTIWQLTDNLTLYAEYQDVEQYIVISAENQNATFNVVIRDGLNNQVYSEYNATLTNTITVYTSYSILIEATANQGYTFAEYLYDDLDFYGLVITDNQFVADRFVSDGQSAIEVYITTTANTNYITLNDNGYGYITATYNDITYDSRDELNNIVPIKTAQTLQLQYFENAGYEFEGFVVVGTGEVEDLQFTGFTTDATITANFIPVKNVITIEVEDDAGLGVGGVAYVTDDNSEIIDNLNQIATGVSLIVYFEKPANFDVFEVIGVYDEDENSISDQVLVNVFYNDTYFFATIDGFTSNIVVKFKYTANSYNVTIKYYEYDETATLDGNKYIEISGQEGYIAHNFKANINYTFNNQAYELNDVLDGNVNSIKYNNSLVVIADFERIGYKLYQLGYGLTYYVGDVPQTSIISINSSIVLDKDLEIRIILERLEYSVQYKVEGKGTLLDGLSKEIVGATYTVRYGRQVNRLTAKPQTYYELLGWYINDDTDSIIAELSDDNLIVNENMTLTAVFIGQENNLTFKIVGVSNYDITNVNIEDEQQIGLFANAYVNGSPVSIIANAGNMELRIVYRTGDIIKLLFNPNSYYVFEDAERNDDGYYVLEFNSAMPTDFAGNSHTINLRLKEYAITYTTQTSGVMEINESTENSIIVNVVHGDSVYVKMYVKNGYALNLTDSDIDGLSIDDGTITSGLDKNSNRIYYIFEHLDVTSDKTITLVFEKQYFKVSFNTNYPDIENLEDNDIFESYYVVFGEKDIYSDKAMTTRISQSQLADIIIENYTNSEGIVYDFAGWLPESPSIFGKLYIVKENGTICYTSSDTEYGFNGLGVATTDKEIPITLYGSWGLNYYQISFEMATSGIIADISQVDLFANVVIDHLIIDDNKFMAPQGTEFRGLNLPYNSKYKYYGYSVDAVDGTIITGPFRYVMDRNDVTIYLHYSFETKVECIVDGNDNGTNSAYIVSGDETHSVISILPGEYVTYMAVAGDGYEFVRWEVEGSMYDEIYSNTNSDLKESTLYLKVNGPITVMAVFATKSVALSIVYDTITNETVSFDASQLVTISTARVGETVNIYFDESKIEYGYELSAIMVNGNNLTRALDDNGIWIYTYNITEADGENGFVEVYTFGNVLTVKIQFIINDESGGNILESQTIVTGLTTEYVYGSSLAINADISIRYEFVKFVINETEYNISSIILNASEQRGFKVAKFGTNTVTLEVKTKYWIDYAEEYAGSGTEASPFLIGSAEQLAYMAKVINSGELNQEERRYYFRITDNIDLKNMFWTPIGTEEFPFDGIFELGEFKITNVFFETGKEPEHLSWSEYCYGVFGYITERAEIITERNILPAILLFGSIALAIVASGAVITAIVIKRKKKLKQVSDNLVASEGQDNADIQDDINSLEDINIDSGDEVSNVDELVKQTNEEADAKLVSKLRNQGNVLKKQPATSMVDGTANGAPVRPNISAVTPNAPPSKPNVMQAPPVRPTQTVPPPKPNQALGGSAPNKPAINNNPQPPIKPKI